MIDEIKRKIRQSKELSKSEVLKLFYCNVKDLTALAFELREEFRGNVITITSTIHISNICSKRCKYCGFSAYSSPAGYYKPFVKSESEVLKLAKCIESSGITRVSCSSAHGWGAYTVKMANMIKEKTLLDVLINVGADLSRETLEDCKADTVCCNLECINERIFTELKPDETLKERIEVCRMICEYGFELSSGLLIGIGESYTDRVEHLFFLKSFPTLGEIPIMGFQPYKGTPMENYPPCSDVEQAKTIAIARILYPELRITSPTPTLNPYTAILAGADNVATVIPDDYPAEIKGVGNPRYWKLSEVLKVIENLDLKAKLRCY